MSQRGNGGHDKHPVKALNDAQVAKNFQTSSDLNESNAALDSSLQEIAAALMRFSNMNEVHE